MKQFARNFISDTRGNFASIFALASVALVGGVGVAVDYNAMVTIRGDLQSQTDAAVLALATNQQFTKFQGRSEEQMKAYAHQVMLENGYPDTAPLPSIIMGEDGHIRVEATLEYPTSLTRIFGFDAMQVAAGASSFSVSINGLEIAMALDVTGSMGVDGKMDALKSSATELVNMLEASGSDKVKIGVVPFSNYVNVGMANRDAPWIDVPPDGSRTETYQHQPKRQVGFKTCTGTTPRTRTVVNDGVTTTSTYMAPSGCTGTNEFVNDGPEVTRTRTITETWQGCVGSRDSGLHLRDDSYTIRIPGLMNRVCAAEILAMTNDYDAVRTRLDELVDDEETYLPAGLAWGQRLLSPQAPYEEAQADTVKYLILMTDGENTLSLLAPTHDGKSPTQTNTDTSRLCTNIKAEDITIFTIAFMVESTATQSLLQNCATDSSTYFRADNAAALNAAFVGIANSALSARLTQ